MSAPFPTLTATVLVCGLLVVAVGTGPLAKATKGRGTKQGKGTRTRCGEDPVPVVVMLCAGAGGLEISLSLSLFLSLPPSVCLAVSFFAGLKGKCPTCFSRSLVVLCCFQESRRPLWCREGRRCCLKGPIHLRGSQAPCLRRQCSRSSICANPRKTCRKVSQVLKRWENLLG